MNLVIENCDIFEEMLYDIIQVIRELLNNERTYKENNRIKNILDDLDNFNFTFQLNGVNIIRYTMLLSMKDVNVELINVTNDYDEIPFSNKEDMEKYLVLLKQFNAWNEILTEKYELPEGLLSYIQPNSRLVNIRISCSIKELMYFINSCLKYNELIDIAVLISEQDELLEGIVSVANLLNDIIVADDLFIRIMLDEDNRNNLLTNGTTFVNVISNEDYIKHCINNYKADVKVSIIGSCSLVAYRKIINSIPKHHIKVENFLDTIKEEFVSITLPKEYCELPDEILNALSVYIQEWFELSQKLNVNEFANEKMLCYLGCYLNVFKMNTMIENYFKLVNDPGLTEVYEIMRIVEQKLTN